MTAYIALLRAVNVGGAGKLPMTQLKAMCDSAGFAKARTYIASGNALFESDLPEAEVQASLAQALEAYAGKPVGVLVRTADEMAAVANANPFADKPGDRVIAMFLNEAPPSDALQHARHVASEAMALGVREIYIHHPKGQADTRLVIPAAKAATGRNMNTVAKLAELAATL